jgi:hypothetical protein
MAKTTMTDQSVGNELEITATKVSEAPAIAPQVDVNLKKIAPESVGKQEKPTKPSRRTELTMMALSKENTKKTMKTREKPLLKPLANEFQPPI